MARPRSGSREHLAANAMLVFWKQGFASTSVDDLARATRVSRAGIYSDFGSKDELFLGCLDAYRQRYIDPALAVLKEGDDGLSAIEAYFDLFIELHRHHGMPGPGCFFANVMTERAPHEGKALEVVNLHMQDLRRAFRGALKKCGVKANAALTEKDFSELAGFMATASQGLWSYARSSTDIGELERFKSALLQLLKARLAS